MRRRMNILLTGVMTTRFLPGEEPVRPVPAPRPEITVAALKERTGERGMHAYVETLLRPAPDRPRGPAPEPEPEHRPADRAAVPAQRQAGGPGAGR